MKYTDEYIRAGKVAQILKCSKSYAYKVMQQIRAEMKQQGLITLSGRVPRQRFLKRVGMA